MKHWVYWSEHLNKYIKNHVMGWTISIICASSGISKAFSKSLFQYKTKETITYSRWCIHVRTAYSTSSDVIQCLLYLHIKNKGFGSANLFFISSKAFWKIKYKCILKKIWKLYSNAPWGKRHLGIATIIFLLKIFFFFCFHVERRKVRSIAWRKSECSLDVFEWRYTAVFRWQSTSTHNVALNTNDAQRSASLCHLWSR